MPHIHTPPKNEAGKRVGLFVRASAATSWEAVAEACGYAVSKGWTIAQTYFERDVSGRSAFRDSEEKRLVAHIEQGRLDVLIVPSMSHLTKTPSVAPRILDFLLSHGVTLVCIKEQLDAATPLGRWTLLMEWDYLMTARKSNAKAKNAVRNHHE